MRETQKRRFLFGGIFFALFSLLLLGVGYFVKNEIAMSFLEHSENVAIRSFRILGLDGKIRSPKNQKEGMELADSTAELEILEIGEEMIYYPEYAFYLLSSGKDLENQYGKTVWHITDGKKNLKELLSEDILKEMIQLKIVVNEAKKVGVSISEEEKAEITSAVNEQFLKIDPVLAAKYYFNSELLTKIYEENFLATKFFHTFVKERKKEGEKKDEEVLFEEAFKEWENSYYIHIFRENLEKRFFNET